MGTTKIQWATHSWPVVTGCSHAGSPGCDNCYAARMAATRLKHHPRYKGLAEMSNGKPRWTGEVRLNEDVINEPYKWRKPRTVFIASMGDLFHPKVPFIFVVKVFSAVILTQNCTFLVLTKRPERMKEFFSSWKMSCPPNVWLGVTAENQQAANERIPVLVDTPAALRFVSCEPLLGRVSLRRWMWSPAVTEGYPYDLRKVGDGWMGYKCGFPDGIKWVIAGAESGPNRRRAQLDWFRHLRHQSAEANVPYFLKQADIDGRLCKMPELDGRVWDQMPQVSEQK